MGNSLKNLDTRIEFWSKHYQGGAATFFDENLSIFNDKNVLEIGPGEGKMASKICNISSSFSVADISKRILELPIYEKIKPKNKFLITGYDDNFNIKFDIIYFWYVVHHVLPEELEIFFSFIHRHCKKNGVILFNYQDIREYPDSSLDNDGLKTSILDSNKVINSLEKFFIVERKVQYDTVAETFYINILAKKIT